MGGALFRSRAGSIGFGAQLTRKVTFSIFLVQSRRNNAAALRFFRKLFKVWGQPRVVVTDKLRSYGAAKSELAPGIEHRQHKGLNNRSEASHRHTRRREKALSSLQAATAGQWMGAI